MKFDASKIYQLISKFGQRRNFFLTHVPHYIKRCFCIDFCSRAKQQQKNNPPSLAQPDPSLPGGKMGQGLGSIPYFRLSLRNLRYAGIGVNSFDSGSLYVLMLHVCYMQN